eukprot:gnl/TRDRNA2_/TRDRNA2_168050_c1_seq1.p1 gnl/TRDRNA2_/TRDRNA2_168050_c1~~gnl/TRDRNA2_/TRDRNA2_168050_c1_seq1.p1  ORF type:complete len:267 (+),score=48.88 gnl/TRDRNA2_/TRDRNA2_168050_c1_seq1:104-802(+)
MEEDGLTDILNSIIVEQGYQVHQFRNYIKALRGDGGVMKMQTSVGSCYDMNTHKVSCNVDKESCGEYWYKPGYVSDRNGCCHCRASCVSTSDTCKYYDDSAGSCYDIKTHKVSCNVDQESCGEYWYKPGYVSDKNGCCHCRASCEDISDDCKYYDDAPAKEDKHDDHGDKKDDHDGHDHDDHDGHDHDDHDGHDHGDKEDDDKAETSSTTEIKSGLLVALVWLFASSSRFFS